MITFVISKWATVTVKQLCTIVILNGEKTPIFFVYFYETAILLQEIAPEFEETWEK